ncbi:hypothetical protein JHK87_033951 [Glycine soja]|nr:hypothetical protein JHK87_033951 [Glycine soja]
MKANLDASMKKNIGTSVKSLLQHLCDMFLSMAKLGLTRLTLLVSWFKLCKVRSVQFGQKGIPYLNTYDGRTIRYPD